MKELDFITNLKGITEDIRIDKGSILQKDRTSIIFIKSKSKKEIFKEEFIIRDAALFDKVSKGAESFEEMEDRIIFKKKDITIDFMKSEADDSILPKESSDKIEALSYDDAVKIILTDEVKAKLMEAIESGFSEVIKIFSDGENLKISVGGNEGKHKYTAVLGSSDKKFTCLIANEFLKSILGCISGYSEMFVKTKFPIKFTDKTDEYETEIFLAPRTEE